MVSSHISEVPFPGTNSVSATMQGYNFPDKPSPERVPSSPVSAHVVLCGGPGAGRSLQCNDACHLDFGEWVGTCVYHSLFTVMSLLLDPPLLLFSATTNDPLRCGVDSALSLLQWRGESTLLLWAACSIPASLLKCVYCMHARKREGGRGGGKLLVGSNFTLN